MKKQKNEEKLKKEIKKKEKKNTCYNLALKHIHMMYLEIFDKHDYLLYTNVVLLNKRQNSYRNIVKDCNSLCMTVSMLNYGLIERFEK